MILNKRPLQICCIFMIISLCDFVYSNEYPIIFDDQDVSFNYNYEVRIFTSRESCIKPNGEPIRYQVYSQQTMLKIPSMKYSPSSLWAKVVQGRIDRSLCAPGKFSNGTIRFRLKPNLFGSKRIVIVVSNSEKLSFSMGGWKVWYTLIHTMISSYSSKLPVTLVALNEDNRLDFVVQAEDIIYMNRSYRLTNPYPQLTRQIKSRITMDQQIVHPMKSLYAVHDYFKENIKKVIYITDQNNVPGLKHMKLNPNYAKIPLHWNNHGIDLSVITNGKCHSWKKVHAKCYEKDTLKISMLKHILHER
ncbi:hypothetical protein MHK_008754 [Candidatus Magnetomorum sp. HK-1]|nr:hypothetical protein MHK_008754 [Candidatus Magnetomorum sp. HK-1]